MNMFLHELKVYKQSTTIWTLSVVFVSVFFLMFFPTYSSNGEEMKQLLSGFPEEVRLAIGLSIENFTSLLGFYSFIFGYILLCGSIQAMILGTSILSKETMDKTADFLMTKPVSRKQIIQAKIFAALTHLVISNLVYIIAASIMANIVKTEPYDYTVFFMISMTLFFVQIMFMSLGILLSVYLRRIKSVLSLSLGTVFGFYILSMVASSVQDEKLRYLTPFSYFNTGYIIKNSGYETSFVVIWGIFIVTALLSSVLKFSKKDIDSV